MKPIDLVTYNRFDLMAKLAYATYRNKGIFCDYFLELYREHLRVWNDFKEYNNPDKNTFEKFLSDFNDMIDDIGENGFDSGKSIIPISSSNNSVLNGSHRTAACILHNIEPTTKYGKNFVDGQWDCGYEFFNNLGLNKTYMDSMAIEYIKLKPNTKIVTMFPTTDPSKDELVKMILRKYGNVVYDKSILLSKHGLFNLTRQLYVGEQWAGDWSSNFGGFRHKTELCYKDNIPTRIILVEFPESTNTVDCKNEIRDIYKISNHSAHINDTHNETLRLGRMLFNDNSVHYLNNLKMVRSIRFESLLNEYKSLIPNDDNYCITASGVLTMYGLRECNDLDYLHFGDKVSTNNNLISSHNEYGVGRYHTHKDNIIFDPRNHFWYDGIKFASLSVVKKLKSKRNEPKDVVDVKLIESI